MDTSEYYRLAKIEESHWWYRAMHELVVNVMKKGSKGLTFAEQRLNLNILDAGCGTGGLTKKLEKFGRAVGLDISPLALKLAASKGLRLIEGSVNNLPFDKESFDLITSISVLYHQRVDEDKAIKEFYKVLKSNGKLILVLPSFSWLAGGHDRAVATRKRYTLAEAKKLLIEAGFRVLEGRYLFSFLFPVFIFKRMLERFSSSFGAVSDLSMPPKLVNNLLFWLCRVEWWLGRFFKLPFGSSLLVIGEKNSDTNDAN